jgi:L-alanine-DL-glutamate epimerase-like enolase superfamily enzyme
MNIRDIKTYRLGAALAEPFAYSQAWYERRGAMLVEIVGEDGSSGWGEAFGPPELTAPIVEFYNPLLIGTDAFATELHWQEPLQPATRSWPKGPSHRGAERRRHRAVGFEGPASRHAGTLPDGRATAPPHPSLCDRFLS